MWKLVILATAMALTGCGGGAMSAKEEIAVATSITMQLEKTILPSLVEGHFDAQGNTYVVVSGWYISSLAGPPVKILKINPDGTHQDSTRAILGSEFSISVMYPLVADFNNDGVDDIFFMGFTDQPGTGYNLSVAFISRPGQPHARYDYEPRVWSHTSLAVDLNNDGFKDVINGMGQAYINDGTGQFTFQNIVGVSDWDGSGLCAGDFDGTGTSIVSTDGWFSIQDNKIVKVNADFSVTVKATLPMPWFDRGNISSGDYSHDVSCVTGDLNNDGLLDIVVIGADNRPGAASGATTKGNVVQVYLNRGNWQFDDATDTAGIGYHPVHSSYTPRVFDFNGDGRLDIWLMNWDWDGTTANQLWLNKGGAQFEQRQNSWIENKLQQFALLMSTDSKERGIMLPVKVGGKWVAVYTAQVMLKRISVTSTLTDWQF